MYRIGKTFKFEAAHFLPDHDGPCRNLHGHSYEVTVTVCGREVEREGAKAGMLMDYADVKSTVAPWIQGLDHNGLVQDHLPKGHQPSTAENIAYWLFCAMETSFYPHGESLLHAVRVCETALTFAEYEHTPCPTEARRA